jgi:hypothetical protein
LDEKVEFIPVYFSECDEEFLPYNLIYTPPPPIFLEKREKYIYLVASKIQK